MTSLPASEEESSSSDVVQAFARGLAVIRAFDAEHPALTLSEVARRADVTRAAAGRFLRTLQVLGYVRGDGRLFSLTPRVLELGFSFLSSLTLPEVLRPHLKDLSNEVDESASAAVLDGVDIVYIARVPVRRIMSVTITVGTRFPAFVTSMGRVLLAAADPAARESVLSGPLPRLTPLTITDPRVLDDEIIHVRECGWAMVDGELEPGLLSIAAPVHSPDGTVVASINISTSGGKYPAAAIANELVPALLRAAEAIEADLRRL